MYIFVAIKSIWVVIPGHYFRLVDGMNVTVSDEHMWLIPFNEGQNHTVTVNFGQKVLISGLRLWNYNKSKEDTYRGVGGLFPCLEQFRYTINKTTLIDEKIAVITPEFNNMVLTQ